MVKLCAVNYGNPRLQYADTGHQSTTTIYGTLLQFSGAVTLLKNNPVLQYVIGACAIKKPTDCEACLSQQRAPSQHIRSSNHHETSLK